MKIKGLVVSAMFFVLILAYGLSVDNPLHLEATATMHAGDAWELTVTVDGADAGEKVTVAVLNGLKTFDTTLILGSGGIAVWQIPKGQLIQSGDALAIARYKTYEAHHTVTVLPTQASVGDLFTTANTIVAYGEGTATVILIPRDEWGNPPQIDQPLNLHVAFPSGTLQDYTLEYRNGLAWAKIVSEGIPGRVRLRVEYQALTSLLEIQQTASNPKHIALTITPNCVVNDGRDVLELVALVTDSHGSSVVAGTLVKFNWAEGFGSAVTVDGQASLRVPSPLKADTYFFRANIGQVFSPRTVLHVTDGSCADEQ